MRMLSNLLGSSGSKSRRTYHRYNRCMRINICLIIFLVAVIFLAVACSPSSEPTLEPTPIPPLPPVFPSATPHLELADSPNTTIEAPLETAEIILPQAVDIPRPLFLLADKAVWIIRPGIMVVQRLTPPELKVTCFDVWPEDNRMAYGTDTGQIYLVRDTNPEDLTSFLEEEPFMLFDAFPDAPYLVRADSLAWSPDGTYLAFTVDYSTPGASQTAGFPSSPSGLWLFEVASRQATWIESNHYLGPNQSDPNLVRRLTASSWSPDSTGLLVHAISRQGTDALILNTQDPPDFLIDPPGEYWNSSSWRLDSQAVLLSGRQDALTSDLLQVQRDGSEPQILIDGEADDLYIYDATELPSGTAFLAKCAECDPEQVQLYIGHLVGDRFVYTAANIRQYCQNGAPRQIKWDPSGQSGALDCGPGELRFVQFQIDNVVEMDLSNYLRPLGGAEVLKLVWGGE
jgi:hypothetical protein